LVRDGLTHGSRVRVVDEIDETIAAMEFALDSVRPGELLLMQADAIDETMNFIRDYLNRREPAPSVTPASHDALVPRSDARAWPPPKPPQRTPAHPVEYCAGVLAKAPEGAKIW